LFLYDTNHTKNYDFMYFVMIQAINKTQVSGSSIARLGLGRVWEAGLAGLLSPAAGWILMRVNT
jgi:hypothetical protein